MNKQDKIYIAGHRGMVGSAIIRKLHAEGYDNTVTRTHSEMDLTSQTAVADFFRSEKPDVVVLAAAKVGGIHANNVFRAQFLYENLMIQNNVIHSAYTNGGRSSVEFSVTLAAGSKGLSSISFCVG